ncbi:Galactose-specific lectin nattectin [Collichthys lucidus]|uniref:Galactose-specific lectin nattectin n=1 Tax=Collichthys lucidus TaxID=240159 RepID=A0A4U5TZ72_COLLU|nr:Galactose-specific lectin nattectin [Collichthys lucidus]
MKTLALLSLSLAVALGFPAFVQDEAQNHPDLPQEEQSPLLGDLLPAQGHVVMEDPAPQGRLGSEDQQEKVAQVKKEPEVEPEPEVKVEPELEVKVEPEDEPEPEVKVEPEDEPEPEVKVEPEVEPEPQLEDVPNFMAVSEEAEPEMNPEDEVVREVEEKFKVQMSLEPETETGQQLVERHVDMETTSHEVMVEPIMELEPLDDEDNMLGNNVELSEKQRNFEEPIMELEAETETGQQFVERHIDMERTSHEVMVEPIMELEPLDDDDNMLGNDVPEKQRNFEEPIMELEPETRQEEVIPEAAVMEEGPALDINGEPMPPSEEYFPNEEARMELSPIMDQPESEYLREEEPLAYEEPALMRQEQDNQASGLRSCPGVSYEGKCYEFFRGPKKAVDAEFFCQQRFHGGHLASIMSRNIHAKILSMISQQYGRFTRTWVGGLRYLDSGRFIWLDGSRWSYADWLSGEPNNTSNLEDCIEMVPSGKFNDFTCWEPQAFICSYPQ